MTSGPDHLTLLIVSDTPDSLALIIDAIVARGYRVITVQSSKDALHQAHPIYPDLILLDEGLSNEDSFVACQSFQSDTQTHDVPIIFMTADTRVEHKAKCFAAGCSHLITKPLYLDEILSQITTHLELVTARRNLAKYDTQLKAYRANKKQLHTTVGLYRDADAQLAFTQGIIDAIPDILFEVDLQGRYLNVWTHRPELLAVQRENLLGRTINDVLDPQAATIARLAIDEANEKGLSFGKVLLIDLPDGQRWFEHSISRKSGGDPNNPRFIVLSRDITERIQAEAELRRHRDHLEELVSERTIALQSALEFTEGIINAIPDVLFEVDREGRYLNIWTHMPKLLSAPRDELLGKTIHQVLSPEAAATILDALRESEASTNSIAFGHRVQIDLPTSGPSWFELSVSKHPGGMPDEPRFLVLSRDITERIQAEEEIRQMNIELEQRVRERTALLELRNLELRESEQRYREIFENAIEAMYLLEVTKEGRFRNIDINPALAASMGIPREEIIGKFVDEVVSEGVRKQIIEKYQRCLAAGETITEYIELEMPAGTRHYISTITPIRYQGRIHRLIGISRDITERKHMEKALADQEREYRTLVENLPDNVIRYNLTGQAVYYNPNCVRILPEPIDDILGKTPCEGLPENESMVTYQKAMLRVIATGHPEQIEIEVRSTSGAMQIHQINFVAEKRSDGKIRGALAIGRDVTALVVAERRLVKSHARLRELLARREADRNDERRRISRELHDELGQLLTALKLGIWTLKTKFDLDHQAFEEKVTKLLELASQAIQTVRTVATNLRPAALDMGLAPALQWLANEFERQNEATCMLKLPNSLCDLDELRAITIFRTIQEALTNVTRHAEACLVEVILQALPDGTYLLTIRDDGKGFDPTSAPNGHFGLIGMRERIDSLGGTLVIDSTPSTGTCISIRIPDLGFTEEQDP